MGRPRGKKRTATQALAAEPSQPEEEVVGDLSKAEDVAVAGDSTKLEEAGAGDTTMQEAAAEEPAKQEEAAEEPPEQDAAEEEPPKQDAAAGEPSKQDAAAEVPAKPRRGRPPKAKRKQDAAAGEPSKPDAAAEEPTKPRPGRRPKATPKPQEEQTEYFPEKRNLEDLWLSAFPVGTEWENIDKIKEFNWNFENLEKALEEGGQLYGKTVYLFGSTEPQLLDVNGESKIVLVPVVVAVDCPFPPSDKIGINSVQRESEEIVPMKEMKMAWVPYVPLENRLSRIDRLETKIFTLGCTQRRSALKHLKTERVKKFDYCMPYYMPLHPPEDEDDTVVNIIYPLEPPIVCDFDWEMDDYEDFADEKVKDEVLPEDEKEKFKDFVKERVRERKKELKQAKEARKKAIDDMDPKTREAFENIKFYKFYPVKTPDTPDVSNVKAAYINRYYRKAHELM